MALDINLRWRGGGYSPDAAKPDFPRMGSVQDNRLPGKPVTYGPDRQSATGPIEDVRPANIPTPGVSATGTNTHEGAP